MPIHHPNTHQKKAHRSFGCYASVFFTILLLTTGCDALDVAAGDSIFLNSSRVVCFEFTNLASGASKIVVSTDTIDLDAFLSDEGFSKSEIIGAEVSDITVRLRFPGQENLSAIDRIILSLRAGSTNTTIATSSALGSERSINIPTSGNDIGRIVQAASFQAVLDITGAKNISDDITLEVELDFNVELQGV